VCLTNTPMRIGAAVRRPGADAAAVLEEVGFADQIPLLERAWALQIANPPRGWEGPPLPLGEGGGEGSSAQ
jgi:hypothetical protein